MNICERIVFIVSGELLELDSSDDEDLDDQKLISLSKKTRRKRVFIYAESQKTGE
jgi:hypothetical protein